MSQPTLYGNFASPFVRKVRLVLAAKGIEHQHEQTIPHQGGDDFKAASPLGKIPAWRDDNVAISDSSVIIQYLETFYPGEKLIPDTANEYARTLWFEEFADGKLVPILGAHLFAEVVLAKHLFKREPIQSDIDKALNEELPAILPYLESQITDQQYLVGDNLSLADIAIAGVFLLLYLCGHAIDGNTAPQFKAYIERLHREEPFATLFRGDIAGLKQLGYDSPYSV